MDLPPIDYKEGKPHEHIDEEEFHSLYEYEDNATDNLHPEGRTGRRDSEGQTEEQ